MNRSDIPNLISLARMVLVLPVAILMLQGRFGLALLLFAIAGISDGIDGYLAKRYGWFSRLGSLLDPLADKLLLVTSFITLGWLGLVSIWVVAIVLLRDSVILTGALVYRVRFGPFEGRPNTPSKVNTFLQICVVTFVLLNQGLLPIPELLLNGLTALMLMFTVWSGVIYVRVWSRLSRQ
jgi:cardiolipin synthase